MEPYPWWTKEHLQFSEEVKACVDELLPRWWESRWLQEFPRDIFERVGERRYLGAGIPKEYGGLGLGATGACILEEQFGHMPGLGRMLGSSMFGGMRQVIEFGTEEQKKRFLPRIVEGELGSIVITEIFAGTDASGMETTAVRDGDAYILNGKKRFIVSAGTADRYMVYAVTNNDPDEIRAHRHLTGFLVERGLPGFSVEKINEIMGFKNIQNGSLDFDNVRVPVADRIGEEGEGWRVMTGGLNFERTLICAQAVGWLSELLNSLVPYTQRRVQFKKRAIDIQENQFKIADILVKYNTAHLLTYYCAHMWDLEKDITILSNITKIHNCEGALQAAMDAIQARRSRRRRTLLIVR
jgi:alkylation response protein AidB-like acyl-CoA dehydrogenase